MAIEHEENGVTLIRATYAQMRNDMATGIDFSATNNDAFNIVGDTIRNGGRAVRNAAMALFHGVQRIPDIAVDAVSPGKQSYDVVHREGMLAGTGSYAKDITGRKGVIRKAGAAILNFDKPVDDAFNVIGGGKWQIKPSKNIAA